MKRLILLIVILILTVSPCCGESQSKKNNNTDKVAKKVEKLLEKEGYTLEAVMILSKDGVQPQIRVVPTKDKEGKKPK